MGVVQELLEAAVKPRTRVRRAKPWTQTLVGAAKDHPVHSTHPIEDIQQAGDVLHYRMCDLPPSWTTKGTVFLDERHRQPLFDHLMRNQERILEFFPTKSDDGCMRILPWQLMRIYVATHRFEFPQEIRVHGTVPTTGKKGITVEKRYHLPANEVPMFQAIADGPGTGKTLTGIMIAAFFVLDCSTWDYVQENKKYLLERYYAWKEEGFVSGMPRSSTGPWGDPPVARLVVLTMKRTLMDHWIDHIVPFFGALQKHFGKRPHIWDGERRELVIENNGSRVWKSIYDLYEIKKSDPRSMLELAAWLQFPILLFENYEHQADANVYTTAFLGRVFDEHDEETRPQRGEMAPNLLTTVVLNATMRNLVRSFRYNPSNPFRRYLGGSLPDCDMEMEDVLPAQRQTLTKGTNDSLKRTCLLRLLTGPNFLRDAATIGSREYMPPELQIHFLYYRPTPKLQSTNALETQSLSQFLVSMLAFTSVVEVKEAVRAIAESNNVATGDKLIVEIDNLRDAVAQSVDSFGTNAQSSEAKNLKIALSTLQRMVKEVRGVINKAEEDQSCCVCLSDFSENLQKTEMRIASCCQGIYCATCIARLSKCALCRTAISAPVALGIMPPQPMLLKLPERPPSTVPECAVSRAVDRISKQACEESVSLCDGIVTLIADHIANVDRPARILLYFNETTVNGDSQRRVATTIGNKTNAIVKNLTRCSISHSHAVSLFKSTDTTPIVLLCGCSERSEAISGLDFKTTTLMIFHGCINTSQAEQLRGRMMRVHAQKTTKAAQLVVTQQLAIKLE